MLLVVCCVRAEEPAAPPKPAITPEQALASAKAWSGFPDETRKGDPVLVAYDAQIPFLSKLCSKQAWKIRYEKVQPEGLEKTKVDTLNFDVFVNTATGQCMSAHAVVKIDGLVFPNPSAESAERQLDSELTKYTAFIRQPKNNLLQAISEMNKEFANQSNRAADIQAICVEVDALDRIEPAWFFTCKSEASEKNIISARRPEVPAWARSSWYHQIHAATGKWQSAGNTPHWIPPADKKVEQK